MPQQSSAYRECRHILTSGRKCHSPALSGKPFCFHHSRHRNFTGRNLRSIDSVELPPLEDQSSILVAINQVVFALTHGRITDKLAGRLFYAIQLAQNAINRTESLTDAELVTDYLDGRYGDIVAPAEPETETSPESSPEPGAEDDDLPLLSEYIKTHSGHGDTCWEPTNGDYPDHAAVDCAAAIPAAAVPAAVDSSLPLSCTPQNVEQEEPLPSPAPPNSEPPQLELPQPSPAKSDPMKSGPTKSGTTNTGPWNHPLLDHIINQLESGVSEREIAAQLTGNHQLHNSPGSSKPPAP